MTLLEKFREFEDKNVGAIPTLHKAIRSIKTTDAEITKIFKKVVPKDEYERKDRNKILLWLLRGKSPQTSL